MMESRGATPPIEDAIRLVPCRDRHEATRVERRGDFLAPNSRKSSDVPCWRWPMRCAGPEFEARLGKRRLDVSGTRAGVGQPEREAPHRAYGTVFSMQILVVQDSFNCTSGHRASCMSLAPAQSSQPPSQTPAFSLRHLRSNTINQAMRRCRDSPSLRGLRIRRPFLPPARIKEGRSASARSDHDIASSRHETRHRGGL